MDAGLERILYLLIVVIVIIVVIFILLKLLGIVLLVTPLQEAHAQGLPHEKNYGKCMQEYNNEKTCKKFHTSSNS